MAKKSNICSSVEGNNLSFNTRQFFSKPPIFNEILKKRVYPFKLGINGYVEIETPIEDPEKTAVYTTSLTEKGDSIQGGSIDGWSTRPIKPPTKGAATGTHSASFGSLKGHSYAHVESPHRDHLQSADIQARHPQVIEIINPIYGFDLKEI
ncbi:hypothetical protein CRENPOLYSF2_2080005 [Crenothrix polyspora]|uniref:Uncharacterized protein n=1 Tax=Crenothrix polyspora TaxID=360316 RepID=A0A1R4H4H5_9GAMM|nr:hypothetical protein [Crenothrix polyspora]SJM91155.1 hypothetical protein CRENPOLYSF2_2080005 [Crenothrix polyspora]